MHGKAHLGPKNEQGSMFGEVEEEGKERRPGECRMLGENKDH